MTKSQPNADPRLGVLHELLLQHASPMDAAFQRSYHKSCLLFFGLKADTLRALTRRVFPGRLNREEHLPLALALWRSEWFEERTAALLLLERLVKLLEPADLLWLAGMTRDCTGWALLDFLTTRVLSPLALAGGDAVYRPVLPWLDDDWLWTRRAAILIHLQPARQAALEHAYAWPSFAARLHEKEFFIRKAVGWALRECCKHYPQQVADFLLQHGSAVCGLTRREASRKLPPQLQQRLD